MTERKSLFERLKNGLVQGIKNIIDPPTICCECRKSKNIMVVGLEMDEQPYKVYCLDCWQQLT